MDWLTPALIADGLQLALLAYFLNGFRKLVSKVDSIGTQLTQLKSEHDTLKSMNKCPLISPDVKIA